MRQDESDERDFPPGSIVWARLAGYPKWPGRVCDLSWIQSRELPRHIPEGKRLVMFFNDDENFSVMEVARLSAYNYEDWKHHPFWAAADPGIPRAAEEADAYMLHWKDRKPGGPMDHGHLTDEYPVQLGAGPGGDMLEVGEDPLSDVNSEMDAEPEEVEPELAGDTRRKKAGKTQARPFRCPRSA
jgi:PWWP domain